MPSPVPTMRWTQAHPEEPQHILVHWTLDGVLNYVIGTEYLEVYRNVDGGAYALHHTYSGHDEEYHYDYDISNNVRYGYKVRFCDSSGCSNFSGASLKTLFLDADDDTIELDESTYDSPVIGDSTSDTITMDELASGIGAASDSAADTMALVDNVGALSTLNLDIDYGYYMGDFLGNIYYENYVYGSDNGTAINAYWLSKETDFSDIDDDAISNFKTVYKARLFYIDHTAGQTVTISISNDGGTTWTPIGRNLGTGDGTTKSADFFFIKTGDTFQFKIEHDDTEGKFQWLNMEVFYSIGGPYFEIT